MTNILVIRCDQDPAHVKPYLILSNLSEADTAIIQETLGHTVPFGCLVITCFIQR